MIGPLRSVDMTLVVNGGPKDTGHTSVGITAARARVLDRLRSRLEPWSIPELADNLDLHRNTVREHLTALTEDGLAEYTEVRSPGPGRPARHYGATALGSGIDYLEMAIAMAETVAELPNASEFIRRTGSAWGERLAAHFDETDPDLDLLGRLGELGFAPRRLDDQTIEFGSCPVLAAARRNMQVVCGIHAEVVYALARPTMGELQVDLCPWGSPTGCLVQLTPTTEEASMGAQVSRQSDEQGADGQQ